MSTRSLLGLIDTLGGHPIRMTAGSAVFRPGGDCSGFVVLKSGVIRVTLISETGREVVLYRVRPGEICLQTFACLAKGLSYSAEGVVEADLDGVVISPTRFQQLMRDSEPFRAALFTAIAARFSEFEHVVETLAFTGLEARVASALLTLAGTDGLVNATHQDIATEIGSAREAVSRQLKSFADEGLISLSRGHIHILDRKHLTQHSINAV